MQTLSIFRALLFLVLLGTSNSLLAQRMDSIVEVRVLGNVTTDASAIRLWLGISPGDKLTENSPQYASAIQRLWKQQRFSDISLQKEKHPLGGVVLIAFVEELPLLRHLEVLGLKGRNDEKVETRFSTGSAQVVNEHFYKTVRHVLLTDLEADGYCTATVAFDSSGFGASWVNVVATVTLGKRCNIESVVLVGNDHVEAREVLRSLKPIQKKKKLWPFEHGRFIAPELIEAEQRLVALYATKGYADARVKLAVLEGSAPHLRKIICTVDEGVPYYLRSITWVGNTRYTNHQLDSMMGMEEGELLNQLRFEQRLIFDPKGNDISSVYMDDGYLFFRLKPKLLRVEGDSADYQVEIYEGQRAVIGKVSIEGNTRTNQHVLLREIRTYPGALFRRSDVLRSQRDLVQLGYLDPQKMDVRIEPNDKNGTVDIVYIVGELPNDRFELSGGFGGNRLVGSLGLKFHNFSTKSLFKLKDYDPIPSGDGQFLSFRAQTSGPDFYSYNIAFEEPWLGGRKANKLGFSAYTSFRAIDDAATLNLFGASTYFGKRLTWPDDYSTVLFTAGYQRFRLSNYPLFTLSNGTVNNAYFGATFKRNSTNNTFFPSRGMLLTLDGTVAPPRSIVQPNTNWENATDQSKYSWLEYHKWKASLAYYTPLQKSKNPKLVLHTRASWGYLGNFNDAIGTAPFNRFYMGGSGMNFAALEGRDAIGLRGYPDNEVSSITGDAVAAKYTAEIKYLAVQQGSLLISLHAFAEAGNTWSGLNTVNPWDLKRSVGLGIRVQTPFFGVIGFDYGWGLDPLDAGSSHKKGQAWPAVTLGLNIGDF